MNASTSNPADTVALQLARHRVRRAAAVPTVSVLVGPVGTGGRVWREWAGIAVVSGTATDAHGLASLVVRAIDHNRDLLADACVFLEAHTGRSADELRAVINAMSRRDLDLFFAANDGRLPPGGAAHLSRAILERVVSGAVPLAESFLADGAADPLAILAGLCELVPPETLPAVLLTAPASVGLSAWFSSVGGAAVAVATRVPALPLAIATPSVVWTNNLNTTPESHAKALLREGAIELPILDRAGVEDVLRQAGIEPPVIPPAVRDFVAEGVPDTFARATAEAIAAPTAAATPDEDDQARSAAERFLFEFLELLPDTAGRFELNAAAGFRFGSRAAEIDLLARELRIAIEIDGYYHFRDPAAYRRDRAKDWELQQRGFLVLRFLANDIIPRLEEVRDRILAAVAHPRAASGEPA